MFSKAILVVVVAAVSYRFQQFMNWHGANSKNYNHYPGVCKRVPGVDYGTEDVQVMSDGKAFLTSGIMISERLKEAAGRPELTGKMILFDFKNPSAGAQELRIKADKTGFDINKFRPHGMAVLEDKKKGEHLIYVVNHVAGLSDVVEKFRYSPKTKELVHLKGIPVGHKMVMSNDLALVAEDQFYITHYHTFHNIVFQLIEFFFPLRRGGVYFYNGTELDMVIPNINLANGIYLSNDHRFLYVLGFQDHAVLVYSLSSPDKGPQLLQTVQIHGKGDNVIVTPTEDALLVGAHPHAFKFAHHLASPDLSSPSSVVRLPLGKDNLIQESGITEMFYDDGDMISASSVAAIFDGQMLIGSIMDSLVHCDLYT